MNDCSRHAQAVVALRGYAMDKECLAEWIHRCTAEHVRAIYVRNSDQHLVKLKALAEQLLVATIMEAQARHSRLLTLADLQKALASFPNGTPFCTQE